MEARTQETIREVTGSAVTLFHEKATANLFNVAGQSNCLNSSGARCHQPSRELNQSGFCGGARSH
jgi:hypothetical protein